MAKKDVNEMFRNMDKITKSLPQYRVYYVPFIFLRSSSAYESINHPHFFQVFRELSELHFKLPHKCVTFENEVSKEPPKLTYRCKDVSSKVDHSRPAALKLRKNLISFVHKGQ